MTQNDHKKTHVLSKGVLLTISAPSIVKRAMRKNAGCAYVHDKTCAFLKFFEFECKEIVIFLIVHIHM